MTYPQFVQIAEKTEGAMGFLVNFLWFTQPLVLSLAF